MATFLLIIIYLAFISLGLPDSLLGSAWPVMQIELGAPLEMAGFLFMMIAIGTIISSLLSGRVLKRFGTGKVTFVSVLMTACALLGIQFAPSIAWLVLCAIPLGLGAGAVDSGLNDYVATHYKAHHMSWLHCFWGVGATSGPIIMAHFMANNNEWRNGYLIIACVQFALVLILFLTLPLWKKIKPNSITTDHSESGVNYALERDNANKSPLRIKGVNLALASFLFYCGVEATVGLWGSSFLVEVKGLSASTAAQWVSLYYGGITVGRFITGFVTFKFTNRILVRTGQMIALMGAIILLLPLSSIFSLIGFIIIGIGLAPIFPCMLHETPARFGNKHSQTIMGYQMALAYTGTTFLPPLLGFLASQSTIGIFPISIAIFVVAMYFCTEILNRVIKNQKSKYEDNAQSVIK